MLLRKVRKVGSSLVISMPTHILDAFEIKNKDRVVITVINYNTIGIQKYIKKGIR